MGEGRNACWNAGTGGVIWEQSGRVKQRDGFSNNGLRRQTTLFPGSTRKSGQQVKEKNKREKEKRPSKTAAQRGKPN